MESFRTILKSNWIAPLGPYVDQFEQDTAKYVGVNSATALSSGTAALHLSLKILNVKNGDIVLCPSFTFAASANVILYENATPVFIDADQKSWTIDVSSLEYAMNKYKPKALIAVDIYGQSCDYDTITDLCNKYNVLVIEDAAEALGSKYKDRKCGSFGEMGILSFNGNKIITTSGGGMILSNNEDYIKKARFLSTQAREPELHYEHKELGYNYRLSNLLASLGTGQLEKIDKYVKRRIEIFTRYQKAFKDVEGITFMKEANYCKMNRWLTALVIDERKLGTSSKKIIKYLEENNIESRPLWKPMHLQPLYKKYDFISKNDKDISKFLFENGLCLPSGSNLSNQEQNRIINIIFSLIN